MSQPGLFNENEIPEHIYRLFDVKYDKEAFLKPTRETVNDIYTKFLDKVNVDWRTPRIPGQSEPLPLIQMLCYLRMIISHYDSCFEFTMTDLINPTRKRTLMFCNVIILFKVELDDLVTNARQCEMKQAERQEGLQMLKREVSARRVLLEELAFKKGQLDDPSERKNKISAMRRELEVNKKAASKLAEEPPRIKESISKLNQAKQLKLIALQETAQRIERDTQKQKLKLREAELIEKLSAVNRDYDELKARNSLRQMEKQTEEQRLVRQIKQLHQKIEDIKARIDSHTETTKKDIAQLDLKKKDYLEETEKYIARLNLDESSIVKKFTDSRTIIDKTKSTLANYAIRLRESVESPKDRTFIKPRT